MAERQQRPSWMVPAVVGAFIVVFIAIAFILALGGRPRGDASGTRAFRPVHLWGAAAAFGVGEGGQIAP